MNQKKIRGELTYCQFHRERKSCLHGADGSYLADFDDVLIEKFKIAFWNTLWAKFTLIGSLEVFLQSTVLIARPEPTLSNYGHLIFWTIYLIVVVIIRYKKEWNVKR